MGKKVLVIGGGGREHALAKALARSPEVQMVFCAPGNGGTALEGKCMNVPASIQSIDELATLAYQERISLTVVGPEKLLVEGIADCWSRLGSEYRIWGPKAAQG